MPAIIYVLFIHNLCIFLFLYYLVPSLQQQHAESVLRQHGAGHNHLLFIYVFSVYSGSMREASCGSRMPAIIIKLLLFMRYYLFVHCLVPVATTRRQPLIFIIYLLRSIISLLFYLFIIY
jgi:hypothetical protein